MTWLTKIRKSASSLSPLLVFSILACLYFWRNLTPNAGDRIYLNSDFLAYFYPTYLTAITRIRQGDFLPLWDSTQYLGMPFLAGIHMAFFYPFHLIFYFSAALLNLSWSQIYFTSLVMILGQLALAGVFTYFCTRRVLNLGRTPSFIAGIVYAFSEVMIASVNTVGVMESLIWLPLLLLLLDHLLKKPSAKAVSFLALVYAVSILAGYPYTIVYNSLFLAGYLIFWNLALPTKKIAKKEWSLLFLSLALGVGLSAIQFLPFWELAKQSYRRELGFEGSAFSVNIEPAHLVDYFFPLYFSRLGGNYQERFKGFGNYVGVATIILALLALRDNKRRGLVTFLWSALAISLFMSMGGYTFLHSVLYLFVPFYSKLRTIAIASYLTSFCFALLAAMGLDHLLSIPKEEKPAVGRHLRWFALVLLIPAGLSLLKYLEMHRFENNVAGLETLLTEIEMFNLFILFALLSLGVIFIYLKFFSDKRFLQVTITTLLLLDLFSLGRHFKANNSPIPPFNFYNRDNEVYAFLSTQQKNSLPFRVEWPDLSFHYHSAPFGLDQVGGYQPLTPEKISSRLIPYLDTLAKASALKRLLNVRYLVATTPLPDKTAKAELLQTFQVDKNNRQNYWVLSENGWINPSEGTALYLYELEALPRVYFTDNVLSLPEEEILPYLAKVGDQKAAVVVNDPLLPAAIAAANRQLDKKLTSSLRLLTYQPEKVVIEAQVDREGLLVFGDNDFPGWQATIDGRKSRIIPVNYFMKSVYLPPGTHQVTFSYRPTSLLAGIIISIISSLVTVSFLL